MKILNDVKTERQVVSTAMTNAEKCATILNHISPVCFSDNVLKIIFESISETFSKTGNSSMEAIAAHLIENGKDSYLENLYELIPIQPLMDVHYSIRTLTELHKRRLTSAVLDYAKEQPDNIEIVIGDTISKLVSISNNDTIRCKSIADLAREPLKKKVSFISTGIEKIDNNIGGFAPGNLVLYGARTGVGKTVFATNIAVNVAKTQPVLFFTLEMTLDDIRYNILQITGGIHKDKIKLDLLSKTEREIVTVANENIKKLNLDIVEGVRDISQISSIIRSKTMRQKYGLILIDYIQMIKASDTKQQRHLQIGEVSKTLKFLALDIGTPIFTPAQLSRGIENSSEEPTLSDLRESGDLEQDADIVFLAWKQNKHTKDIRVSCAKNRNSGHLFTINMAFDSNRLSFY